MVDGPPREPSPALTASALLLQRAQAGDGAALASLVSLYLPRLRRWATGRLPAAARTLLDTEDVVQETVIAAVRQLDHLDLRDEGALQAYLRRALANRFIDAYRQSRHAPAYAALDSALPAPEPSPLELRIGAEALERYERAVERLAERDRQAIILRIEFCLSYEEIADALKTSGAGHARVVVSRALTRLAREMHHARG
ncbi:MAG TPA: sigma-70 family RNA polymerase sigma factor [Vicinamibacterales bacterium]|nr:sigma-70 family RNA polymerase sigma factor [Vicinamibacterales bacterium]